MILSPVRRTSLFFVGAALLFQSLPAMAAESWGLPAAGNVTRAEFIRAAVEAMEIPANKQNADTPASTRGTRGFRLSVEVAQSRNALAVFGDDLQLSRHITRLEAVQVLVALERELKTGVKDPFRDVRDDTVAADAATTVVEKGWIKPMRPKVFGSNRLLTAAEALTLVKYAGDKMPMRPTKPTIELDLQRSGSQSTNNVPNARILDTVWQIIRSDYLYQDRVKPEEAMQVGIQEMVKNLGDPYSSYLPPKSAQQFQSQIDGQVSGIGAQVEDRGGVLTVVTPLPESPAQKAGLKPNDQILEVDGKSIAGLGFAEAVDKIRGPRGTAVVLTVKRDGQQFKVTVTRDTVKVPEIEIKWQGRIAIVRIMQFGKLTDNDLRGLMEEVQQRKPAGIILDLRNNPGGLLHAAETVMSNFVPKGSTVAIIRSRDGDVVDKTEEEPTIDPAVPLVVLVNEGSASASEIVAGSLQDHDRATILGTKTFGKGTVQEVLEFIDHSSLKLTIAEWFTPKDRKIDGLGVKPDVLVEYEQDRDAQLLRALELLPR
jgi:carboxyl-terminal processing protease